MSVQVFISHTGIEKDLAIFLKDRIERDFLGLVNVFVSSDQESIEAGDSWLDALHRALKSANLEVILCSPTSITKPWVNFEAGAAWLQGIPVVPICHSGLRTGALPMPLSSLQGGESSDPNTYVRLYNRIAKLVPCGTPGIDMAALAASAQSFDTASHTCRSWSVCRCSPCAAGRVLVARTARSGGSRRQEGDSVTGRLTGAGSLQDANRSGCKSDRRGGEDPGDQSACYLSKSRRHHSNL